MKKASILMVLGCLLLLGLFAFPLWNIELGAPQYPEPLGLNIYINGIQGQSEFDIQNIDGLNHYIGMKKLPKPEEMWEFSVFPLVIGGMVILGVGLGLMGFFKKITFHWFFGWFMLMSILGVLGMYDFNAWMIDYGTNLDPKAIMKLANPDGSPMNYKPPLFGHQKMLNFDAYSYPRLGAYLMFVGMCLTLLAGYLGWDATKKTGPANMEAKALVYFLFFMGLSSCNHGPKPIAYGDAGCHFCSMTIVDRQHAAQIVSDKGKIYNFDATECALNQLKEFEPNEVGMVLVNDYSTPGKLIPVEQASFIISQGIPSPMGAYITAFGTQEGAQEAITEHGGDIHTWSSLNKQFKTSSHAN